MNKPLLLPFIFLKFWYLEAPVEMIRLFHSFNIYFAQLFALPQSVKSYFKPLKNEYREGLVGFSRAIGILIKSGLIFTDLILMIFILFIEFAFIVSFISLPVATLMLLFF